MKQTLRLTNGLIASAIALAMISTVTAQTAVEGTAKVIRVKGPARYTTGNNVWLPVKAGTVLRAGTIIQTSTEQGSFVDLALGDGAAVALPSGAKYAPAIPRSMNDSGYAPTAELNGLHMAENTALGIDKMSTMQTGADQVTDTQLDLKAGHITGNAKKMSAASKYEIKMPNGVAGIRGASFDISADGVVKVPVGSVVLAWVNPKSGEVVTQVVNGGYQYDARAGGQPSAINASDFENITALLARMGVPAPAMEQVTYAADKTVVNVSPVR